MDSTEDEIYINEGENQGPKPEILIKKEKDKLIKKWVFIKFITNGKKL